MVMSFIIYIENGCNKERRLTISFMGLFVFEVITKENTPQTYKVVDTNNKKYELKGYCDENDMYCTTEEKETIKVISFKVIEHEEK